jgi:hypothetical protein
MSSPFSVLFPIFEKIVSNSPPMEGRDPYRGKGKRGKKEERAKKLRISKSQIHCPSPQLSNFPEKSSKGGVPEGELF